MAHRERGSANRVLISQGLEVAVDVVLEGFLGRAERKWRGPQTTAQAEVTGVGKARAAVDRCQLESFFAFGERPGEVFEGDGVIFVGDEFDGVKRELPFGSGESADEARVFHRQDVVWAARKSFLEDDEQFVERKPDVDAVFCEFDARPKKECADGAASDQTEFEDSHTR